MGLRLFADHCVSNTIMQTLREAGREVVRLREQLPIESPDADVIAKAQQLDAILLALNRDFADMVTYPPAAYQGIIALQVRNTRRSFRSSWTGCKTTYRLMLPRVLSR
jgi:predicted nuclease of predicted toxin-antitoxin system